MNNEKKMHFKWGIVTGIAMVLICLGIVVLLILITSTSTMQSPGVLSRGLAMLVLIFFTTILSVAAMYSKKGKVYWLTWLWVGIVNTIIFLAAYLVDSGIEKLDINSIFVLTIGGFGIPTLAESLQKKIENISKNLF
ncbi:MAG: hypothetical protein K8R67_17645 [Desulfobacteraceae bacterium]|nr:hypothetical protein [Desulfobacteraceae bacterium]